MKKKQNDTPKYNYTCYLCFADQLISGEHNWVRCGSCSRITNMYTEINYVCSYCRNYISSEINSRRMECNSCFNQEETMDIIRKNLISIPFFRSSYEILEYAKRIERATDNDYSGNDCNNESNSQLAQLGLYGLKIPTIQNVSGDSGIEEEYVLSNFEEIGIWRVPEKSYVDDLGIFTHQNSTLLGEAIPGENSAAMYHFNKSNVNKQIKKMNCFMCFTVINSKRLREKFPEMDFEKIGHVLSKIWNSLTSADKKAWKEFSDYLWKTQTSGNLIKI